MSDRRQLPTTVYCNIYGSSPWRSEECVRLKRIRQWSYMMTRSKYGSTAVKAPPPTRSTTCRGTYSRNAISLEYVVTLASHVCVVHDVLLQFVRIYTVVMRHLYSRLQTDIFCLQAVCFCPVKRGNLVGSSRNKVWLLPEMYPDQFVVFRFSRVAVERIWDWLIWSLFN